jgi:hypothetical protein
MFYVAALTIRVARILAILAAGDQFPFNRWNETLGDRIGLR